LGARVSCRCSLNGEDCTRNGEGLHEDVVDRVQADGQVYVSVLLRVPNYVKVRQCEVAHDAGVTLRIFDGVGDSDVLFVAFEVLVEGGVEFDEFEFTSVREFVLLIKHGGEEAVQHSYIIQPISKYRINSKMRRINSNYLFNSKIIRNWLRFLSVKNAESVHLIMFWSK
jgi:hypothetical protein